MYRIAIPVVVALTPALLAAQGSPAASAKASGKTDAQVSTGAGEVSSSNSVDAEITLARKKGLPTRAIENRVAEGRAKGATDAELATAAAETRANLESANDVLVSAGRQHPKDQEVERGSELLASGYTRAQLEAVVHAAPSDRSLVVAFDVLSRLRARGVASEQALAQVRSKLESRAADADIETLVGANANATTGLGAANAGGSAAAGASGKAGAAVGAAGSAAAGAAGVTAGVTGTVKGVLKKP